MGHGQTRGVELTRILDDVAHVDQNLRVRLHDGGELGESRLLTRHLGHQRQPRQDSFISLIVQLREKVLAPNRTARELPQSGHEPLDFLSQKPIAVSLRYSAASATRPRCRRRSP